MSYRREDSGGDTGRIADRLRKEFGDDTVFMDVDGVHLGVDFVKHLTEEVARCDVLLAVIGRSWVDFPDETGARRLDNPADFVRVELRAALQRDIPVIPVLINGARVPRRDLLPADIAPLAVRNGLDVRHVSFHTDLNRLVRELKPKAADDAPEPTPPPALTTPRRAPDSGSTMVRPGIRRYYFFAFSITLVLIAFLVSLLFVYRNGSADITVELKQSALEPDAGRNRFNFFSSPAYSRDIAGNDGADDDKTLQYVYSKAGKRITLTPVLKYLESQRRGEPAVGFYWRNDPFTWDFPSLSVKVVNNGRQNLVLSEVVFRVKTSVRDDRPVFAVVGNSSSGTAAIRNEGWGDIKSPSLQVSIKDADRCGSFDLSNPAKIPLEPRANYGPLSRDSFEHATIDDAGNVNFNIRHLVSDDFIDRNMTCTDAISEVCTGGSCSYSRELSGTKCVETRPREKCVSVDPVPSNELIAKITRKQNNPDVYFRRQCSRSACVHGRLDFVDQAGHPGLLNFSTISILKPPGREAAEAAAAVEAPMAPSFSYDVSLEAGKSDYTKRLSIAQQIKSGEADNFSLKLATDRSASFDFDVDILAVDGSVAWTGSFSAGLLVPRSGARRARNITNVPAAGAAGVKAR
jgi:TIR domain